MKNWNTIAATTGTEVQRSRNDTTIPHEKFPLQDWIKRTTDDERQGLAHLIYESEHNLSRTDQHSSKFQIITSMPVTVTGITIV